MRIMVSLSYLECVTKSDKKQQKIALDTLEKIRENPESSGLHIEPLKNAPKNVRSIRNNRGYRAIGLINDDTLTLVHFGDHEGTYQWVNGRSIESLEKLALNASELTDDYFEAQAPEYREFSGMLYTYSNEQLSQLGFSLPEIIFIRNTASKTDFDIIKASLPRDKADILDFCVDGMPFEELLVLAEDTKKNSDILPGDAPMSNGCFIIDSEHSVEDFRRAAFGEIEQWMLFLHPSQEKYAFGSFDGPVFLSGAAGTGKTVAALHRAAYLAGKLNNSEKILFTTYTKNLAKNISSALDNMCKKSRDKIQVINIDALIAKLYRGRFGAKIEYKVKDIFRELLSEMPDNFGLNADFFLKEWERIITPNGIVTKEQYMRVSREGMGYPLNRERRSAVWNVMEKFRDRLLSSGNVDKNLACCQLAEKLSEEEPQYKHIIIDEIQDFSVNMLRMISAIAGKPRRDNIFMVGDRMQNIYGGADSFENCDIDIGDREFVLKINYRTTNEIGRYAADLLGDEESITSRSLMHNKEPETLSAAKGDYSVILPFVELVSGSGESLCIVSRIKADMYGISAFLNERDYKITVLDGIASEKTPGICIATFHGVKGLEFDNIIIWDMERWITENTPRTFGSDRASSKEKEHTERHLAYVAAT